MCWRKSAALCFHWMKAFTADTLDLENLCQYFRTVDFGSVYTVEERPKVCRIWISRQWVRSLWVLTLGLVSTKYLYSCALIMFCPVQRDVSVQLFFEETSLRVLPCDLKDWLSGWMFSARTCSNNSLLTTVAHKDRKCCASLPCLWCVAVVLNLVAAQDLSLCCRCCDPAEEHQWCCCCCSSPTQCFIWTLNTSVSTVFTSSLRQGNSWLPAGRWMFLFVVLLCLWAKHWVEYDGVQPE